MKRFEEVQYISEFYYVCTLQGLIFVKKDKTAVKKFAFQNDDTWLLPTHHQRSPLLSNTPINCKPHHPHLGYMGICQAPCVLFPTYGATPLKQIPIQNPTTPSTTQGDMKQYHMLEKYCMGVSKLFSLH